MSWQCAGYGGMPQPRLRTFQVEIVYAAATAAKLFQRVVGMGVRKNNVSFSSSLTLDYSSQSSIPTKDVR